MAYRDLGTTGEGTHHFWQQRLSGLSNLFLGGACVAFLNFYGRDSHSEVLAWFSQPWMVGVVAAFVLSALWHMRLGLGVIIDDYVHREGLRLFCHIINIFTTLMAALFVVLALVQILLGDAAAAAPASEPSSFAPAVEQTAPQNPAPDVMEQEIPDEIDEELF